VPLVDRHGDIRGPELENLLPSRSFFRCLRQDGTLREGPPLSGYYTTYPALDRDGLAVFALNDELLMVDTDLGSLDTGVWPCGDANLAGNPVLTSSARPS